LQICVDEPANRNRTAQNNSANFFFIFRPQRLGTPVHIRACGFPKLLKLGDAYADIIAVDEKERQVKIEVEYESANFETEHISEAEKCDLIVCW